MNDDLKVKYIFIEIDKAAEMNLRRRVTKFGFILRKDRAKSRCFNHCGGFMILDSQGTIKAGENFDLTIDDVEKLLLSQ